MSNLQLLQQLAFLGYLQSNSERDKEILTAVTGVQVARQLINLFTGQEEVDACKKKCIQSIAEFIQRNPHASLQEINIEVEKHVLLFAAGVQTIDSAPLLQM